MAKKPIKKKISDKQPVGDETVGFETIYTPNMPTIGGTLPPGFANPIEIKDGGMTGDKEEKTPSQIIKENTPKDAAKIFIEERIKARNEQVKKKTGQNYFEFSDGGMTKDPYLKRNEFKKGFYDQKNKPPITAETMYGKGTKRVLEQEEISPDDSMMRYKSGGVAALDESKEHEGMESMSMEAKETRLEKKGYKETKSGKMVKGKRDGGMVRGYGAAIKGKNFKGIF